MAVAKIAISLDQKVVHKLDALVRRGVFPSRNDVTAVQMLY